MALNVGYSVESNHSIEERKKLFLCIVSVDQEGLSHSRHQSLGSTLGSEKLCVGEHAP